MWENSLKARILSQVEAERKDTENWRCLEKAWKRQWCGERSLSSALNTWLWSQALPFWPHGSDGHLIRWASVSWPVKKRIKYQLHGVTIMSSWDQIWKSTLETPKSHTSGVPSPPPPTAPPTDSRPQEPTYLSPAAGLFLHHSLSVPVLKNAHKWPLHKCLYCQLNK